MASAQEEHNQGQRDGAKATGWDALMMEWNPLLSSAYREGFRHALDQQRRTVSSSDSERPTFSGGGGGGDLGPLFLVFGAVAVVVAAPIALLIWAIRKPIRMLPILAYLLLFVVGFSLHEGNEKDVGFQIIIIAFWLFFPALSLAVGSSKRRPLLGLTLGLFFQILGLIIIALVPERKKPVSSQY